MFLEQAIRDYWAAYGPVVLTITPVLSFLTLLVTLSIFFANRKQAKKQLAEQKYLIEQQGQQQIKRLEVEFTRQDDLKNREYRDAEAAERQIVCDYIVDFIARLDDLATLQINNFHSAPEAVTKRYKQFQQYLSGKVVDQVHHERNWGIWYTFLLFQILGAFNLIGAARWQRRMTEEQAAFLRVFDDRVIPVVSSASYPGKRFLYRDQLDVVAEEMIIKSAHTGIIRPIHWTEFHSKYVTHAWFKELCDIGAEGFRVVTDDDVVVDERKDAQARLCILVLYMISILKKSGLQISEAIFAKENDLWRDLAFTFRRQTRDNEGREPTWYVFERGDVKAHADKLKAVA